MSKNKVCLNNRLKFNVLEGGLSFLAFLSCFTVGFSSWIVGNVPPTVNINSEIGDVVEVDLSNSVYYLVGSEKSFSFYNYNNRRYYTNTSFSLRCKCRPDFLKSYYCTQERNMHIGLSYSYYTIENYDIFKSENSFLEVPMYFRIQLDKCENRILYSNQLSYSTSIFSNQTTYNLAGDLLVYSDYKPCLYSLTKDYQVGTEYVYFSIYFDFGNLSINDDTIFPKLIFNYNTNLKGASN